MSVLNTAQRKKISGGQFALPPGAEEKRRGIKGRYPIHDEAHARNALARVSQYGSESEKARVRAAVHRKFPEIGREEKVDSLKERYRRE